ncbi:cation transporter [Corynebacterium guaraldiae]|uniref:Cation transporter n=1 Tax=Corynebacterium guaraldiae TaxID=3051103 RepID=A0ABY3CUL7_9CORY|nr:cation diffusion facilitator family transporter [Corynebacterium guaraldiae]TRX49397.1 cation transporter [Corynebacterium guaraldiae]TRX52289.1 cation transporter [Corynebacterium guaraldiae]
MAHEHHDHDHSSTPLRALLIALSITGIVFFAELIGGWLAGSMALMADAMHMLSDAAGLIIAVIAVLVGRRQASAQATYGYRRVEVLAALANAVMVLAISVWIVVEAVRRLQSPAEVQGKAMLIIAVIGLVANALSAWVLHRHRESSINVEGAFLHVLVDMLGSVAVIVAGVVVLTTGFVAADVIASLAIAAMVLPRAWQLMRLSASVLLEQVPAGFDASVIEPALRQVEGVADIHDLHLWSLDGVNVLTTVHIVRDGTVDTGPLLDAAQHVLREHGIEHSTIQIEHPEHESHETVC